jgi:hypothetical protein
MRLLITPVMLNTLFIVVPAVVDILHAINVSLLIAAHGDSIKLGDVYFGNL